MAQKYGSRTTWQDPADWVMSSCPWKDENSLDWSSLLRIRTEDVGCDSIPVSMSESNSATDTQGSLTPEAAESLVSMRYFTLAPVRSTHVRIVDNTEKQNYGTPMQDGEMDLMDSAEYLTSPILIESGAEPL